MRTQDFIKKANAVTNFMHGDDDGSLDWRYGLLGNATLGVGHGIAAKTYMAAARPWADSYDSEPVNQAMKDMAKGHGVNVVPSSVSDIGITKGVDPGSHYNMFSKEIGLGSTFGGTGPFAHELGHAKGGKGLLLANLIGKNITGLGTQASLLSSDKDNSARIANWSTALGATPLLASELDASRRGYQILRGLGESRGKALRSFSGIPTYLGFAALPQLAHKLKDYMGGFTPIDQSKR